MKKPKDPRELAIAMLSRSPCLVQVGAVIADKDGIFSWGHNHAGRNGLGEHAEVHALSRANPKRLKKATLYVAARWKKGKITTARPCEACQRKIAGKLGKVLFRNKLGEWEEMT